MSLSKARQRIFRVWIRAISTSTCSAGPPCLRWTAIASCRRSPATNDGNYGGSNPNGLSDAKIDALTKSASVELDEGKRVGMLKTAFQIAHDRAFYLPLHQQPVAWAMSDKVEIPQFADEYVRPWFAQLK